MKKYIVTVILLLSISWSFSQTVDTARFRVAYNPRLLDFKKINEKAQIKDTVNQQVKFNYYINAQRTDVTFKPAIIKYNKVAPDVLDKMYRNFLKIGFGYPITPLLEFSFHNLQNQKYSYGINVHHYSYWAPPIGKTMKQYPNHPSSDTKAHLHFKRFFKHQTLYSAIDYSHQAARLYGFYKEDFPNYHKDSLKNNFHHLKAVVGLASNYVLEEKKLKQDARLTYDFLYTNWKDMENHLGVNTYFAYDARWAKISGYQQYRFNFNFDYYNNQWDDALLSSKQRRSNAFLINPEIMAHFNIKEYHILIGIGGTIDVNYHKVGGTVYPIAELQLGIVPSILSIYAGVNGDAKHNSLKELLYENPFIRPHLDTVCTTTNYINIYGGVKGNLVKKLNYNIGARYSYSRNLPFYCIDVNSEKLNQYIVEYHNGNTLNVNLTMDYEVIKDLHLNLAANYWLYVLTNKRATPYYKPVFELAFNGSYVLKEKFIFDLNFGLGFGSKALVPNGDRTEFVVKTMKPILDFGLGFEYRINDHFSAFASINNIACQHYAKYYDFKSFGINALVGITYAFGSDSVKLNKGGKAGK